MQRTRSTILVVRHAKVSARGICYGQSEMAVELPNDQAAAQIMREYPSLAADIDVIWTSPLARTLGLAQCLATECARELRVDRRLSELDFGDWEGRSWEDIYREDRARCVAWAEDPMQLSPPRGESAMALVARIDSWQQEIGNARCLVVTHAGPIRVLRARCTQHTIGGAIYLDFDAAVPHLVVEGI